MFKLLHFPALSLIKAMAAMDSRQQQEQFAGLVLENCRGRVEIGKVASLVCSTAGMALGLHRFHIVHILQQLHFLFSGFSVYGFSKTLSPKVHYTHKIAYSASNTCFARF